METTTGFRAIIVGGGVTGLIASHCFSKAGIDHVVLERGAEAAPALGASIAMYPHGARILQQLRLLDATNRVADAMTDGATDRWPDGTSFGWSDIWRFIRENHGHDLVFLERRAFLEVLYDNLPDKSRVLFNRKIVNIIESIDSVEIHMSDGSVEKGDICIGCDGVHSAVRRHMWSRAEILKPGLITAGEKSSIKARWQCLLGYGPAEPGVKNEVSVVHETGHSLMLISPPSQVFFYAFVKIENPYTPDQRPRYTAEDADALAEKFRDKPITEGVTFGDLWKRKSRGQLVDTEDGMFDHWHHGRIVLAGDSVHKMTPNMAFGGNAGIESVAVLSNELRRLLQKSKRPTLKELDTCFQTYEDLRKPRMRKTLEFSDTITKTHAWDNMVLKFLSIWVFPKLPERTLANEIGKLIREAPMLDFTPLGNWPEGKVPWADRNMADNENMGTKTRSRPLLSLQRSKMLDIISSSKAPGPMLSIVALAVIAYRLYLA